MSLPPQPDLILRCSDGDLRAHSLILSLTSPLLLDLIEFERESQPDKKILTFHLNDTTTDVSLLLRALSPSSDGENPRALPNIENAAQLFHLADKYHCPGILAECCNFIENQALALLETTPSARLKDFKINTILQFIAIAKKTGKDKLVSACLSSIGRNFFNYQFQSWANFTGDSDQDLTIRDLDKSDLLQVLLAIPRSPAVIPSPVLNEEQVPVKLPQRIHVQVPPHNYAMAEPLVPR